MFKRTQAAPSAADITQPPESARPASAPKVSAEILQARQETQIWTAFACSPYLRAFDLSVDVRDGNATLWGTVSEDTNKDLARQIAVNVGGIRSVDNRIEVVMNFVPPAKTGDRAFGEIVDVAGDEDAVAGLAHRMPRTPDALQRSGNTFGGRHHYHGVD